MNIQSYTQYLHRHAYGCAHMCIHAKIHHDCTIKDRSRKKEQRSPCKARLFASPDGSIREKVTFIAATHPCRHTKHKAKC